MSKLYVPNSIDIDSVSCVSLESDTVYLTYTNGNIYELKYHDLLSDYTITEISSIDLPCYQVELTHDPFYRKDTSSIMIVFFILSIVCFYFPYRIFARAFGRWLKL